MKPLTVRQQQIFDFICEHRVLYGTSPTMREIGSRLGLSSTNGVEQHLDALERKGWIERSANTFRSIQIVGTRCAQCCGLGIIVPQPS